MSESTGTQPPEELEKRKAERRDLARAYKRFFTSEDGKRILADLESKCNWGRDPYSQGVTGKDLSYRCGTQVPLRHIHTMRDIPLDPLGRTEKKPRSAKSKVSPLSPPTT